VCVYPCYIDVDKSVNEGRKVIKEKAAKNPHAYHMAVAAQQLGFTVVYEVKSRRQENRTCVSQLN
jgi:signal recognition particle subunit SEC65